MRAFMPFILVGLALFTAGCIAYVAWELSSDKSTSKPDSEHDAQDSSH